jgi:2-polyprenyl-3-methyl-5-hydroxy-6-metoxy-1,4-benzoquinol methylase
MDREKLIQEIKDELVRYKQYPQGLEEFGIEGRRSSDMRYKLYGLNTLLKPGFEVLDIGCNCGFLSCLIARKVNRVVGFDRDAPMVKISKLTQRIMGLNNCTFFTEDFENYQTLHPEFDLVLACQMHHWVKMNFEEFSRRIVGFVKPNGYLLFETHNIKTVDKNWYYKLTYLESLGLRPIRTGNWTEENPGRFWIPMKNEPNIPRKFFILRKETEDVR